MGPTQQLGKMGKKKASTAVEVARKSPFFYCFSSKKPSDSLEEDNNLHSMLVDKDENVLANGKVSSDEFEQAMSKSKWSSEDNDMEDELRDDLTLGQA